MSVRAIVAAGALLRLVASAGITATVYVDSAEYRGVALLGGTRRPWTVPLLYAVFHDGAARVVAHAVLGAAAWAALAFAVAEVLDHPRVRVAAAAAVMATGLVSPVTNYDTTITSETVAISLGVLLAAAWLRLLVAPSLGRAIAVVAVAVPFTFTRNDHPLLLSIAAGAALYLAARHPGRPWKVAAAGLFLTCLWGWYAIGRNDEIQRFNLALVVANRVLPDAAATGFFVDRGMPIPAGTDPVLAMAEDAGWNEWAGESGRWVYAQWLLTNPRHLLLEPWPDLFGTRNTTLEEQRTPVVLLAPGDRYGRVHPVLPEPVEALLWGGSTAAPVLLAGLALAAASVRGRRPRGPPARFATALVALGLVHLLVVWHASPLELGRLAMVAATAMHVGLLLLVALAVDDELRVRSGRARPAARPG